MGLIRRRPRPGDPDDVALVLELLARELRGGVSVTDALAAVAVNEQVDLGLDEVIGRVANGSPLGDELDRWCERLPTDDAHLVRAVLRLGVSTGAALAGALDRAAATIRERTELGAELRALSAQSRASAVMIAVAPIGFLAVLGLADPGGVALLVTTPLGWACLAGGSILDGIGFWWMRRLVAGVTT